MKIVPLPDNGGKRRRKDRRKTIEAAVTERRTGKDRRNGFDRRKKPRYWG